MFGNKYDDLRLTKEQLDSLTIDSNYIKSGQSSDATRRIFKNQNYDAYERMQLGVLKEQLQLKQVEYKPYSQTDDVLLRFLYANKFNIENTVQSFVNHLYWLADPDQLNCTPEVQKYDNVITILGRDTMLRPMIKIDTNLIRDSDDPLLILKNLIFRLVIIEDYMFAPGLVESWVVLVEAQSKSVFNNPLDVIEHIVNTLSTNFPNSLEMLYIVDASSPCKIIYEHLKNEIMSPELCSKIKFINAQEYQSIIGRIPTKKQTVKIEQPYTQPQQSQQPTQQPQQYQQQPEQKYLGLQPTSQPTISQYVQPQQQSTYQQSQIPQYTQQSNQYIDIPQHSHSTDCPDCPICQKRSLKLQVLKDAPKPATTPQAPQQQLYPMLVYAYGPPMPFQQQDMYLPQLHPQQTQFQSANGSSQSIQFPNQLIVQQQPQQTQQYTQYSQQPTNNTRIGSGQQTPIMKQASIADQLSQQPILLPIQQTIQLPQKSSFVIPAPQSTTMTLVDKIPLEQSQQRLGRNKYDEMIDQYNWDKYGGMPYFQTRFSLKEVDIQQPSTYQMPTQPLPESTYQIPASTYQIPASTYQIPVSTYQIPASTYQIPASTYQSPYSDPSKLITTQEPQSAGTTYKYQDTYKPLPIDTYKPSSYQTYALPSNDTYRSPTTYTIPNDTYKPNNQTYIDNYRPTVNQSQSYLPPNEIYKPTPTNTELPKYNETPYLFVSPPAKEPNYGQQPNTYPFDYSTYNQQSSLEPIKVSTLPQRPPEVSNQYNFDIPMENRPTNLSASEVIKHQDETFIVQENNPKEPIRQTTTDSQCIVF